MLYEDAIEDADTHTNDDATGPEADLIPNERRGLVREFLDFIVYNAAWWMIPIIVVLGAMVAFILVAESSPVLPFIYTVI